jgi:dTDP-4-dehydrorhamnose reductase
MAWLVTGAGGMLGQELATLLGDDPEVKLTAVPRAELDITDAPAVRAAVSGHDVVVNAAAWTDVDAAEHDEQAAADVNGTGAANVAAACADAGAVLLQVSTDYVFSGAGSFPYPEDALPQPCNAYGRTKAIGETAVRSILPQAGYVVRTAWLYGEHGRNFVTAILRRAADQEFLDVVNDQAGQPTWARALAGQLVTLGRAARAGQAPPGAYHATAAGSATWYELARAVFGLCGLDPGRIRPVTSDRFPRPARRPASSVLGHDGWARAGLAPLGYWRPMLADALNSPFFTHLAGDAR